MCAFHNGKADRKSRAEINFADRKPIGTFGEDCAKSLRRRGAAILANVIAEDLFLAVLDR